MPEAVTFTNTIVPMIAVVALVIALPQVLYRDGGSQRMLSMAILWTAIAAFAFGGLVVFLLYAALDPDQFRTLIADPAGRIKFYLGRSLLFIMLWGPVLALVWLVKAQRIEERKGMRMGRDEEAGKGQ